MCVHEVVLTGNGSPPNIVAVEYRLHERCGKSFGLSSLSVV